MRPSASVSRPFVIARYAARRQIRFVNLQRVNPKTLESMMKTEPGKPIDQKKLDNDMRLLYGTGDFEHVNYERGRAEPACLP